jgi:hypothetical protein
MRARRSAKWWYSHERNEQILGRELGRWPAGDVEALLPWTAGQAGEPKPAANANPLEEQFNELRDTWQASVAKWTDFAKEATQGELPSADKLREMLAPAAWAHGAASGPGVFDAALQRVWKARAMPCSGISTASCSSCRS